MRMGESGTDGGGRAKVKMGKVICGWLWIRVEESGMGEGVYYDGKRKSG